MKAPKRLIATTALFAVALVAAAVAPAVAQDQRFPDVPADHYAFEAVEWAAEVGVTLGYGDGTFKPEQPLSKSHAVIFMERYYDEILQAEQSEDFTRADMMVLLKAINDGAIRDTGSGTGTESPSEEGASQRFPDVPADHYAFEAVEWAAEVGVTLGYGDGTFKPEQPLSKSHAVIFMERYYDEILQAEQSEDFTRADMMVLLKAINDGNLNRADTGTGAATPDDRGSFSAVSSSGGFACGLRTDATVTCWGHNSFGQAEAPTGTFAAISTGSFHACGLRPDATITCWGRNNEGQADAPTGTFNAVAPGYVHSCGLRTNGTITCWGHATGLVTVFGLVDPPTGTFSSVTASGRFSCGLRTNGTITCWGANSSGETDAPSGSFQTITAGKRALLRGPHQRSSRMLGL